MIDFITFHIWLRKHAADVCLRTCQRTESTKVPLFPVWITGDRTTATADLALMAQKRFKKEIICLKRA